MSDPVKIAIIFAAAIVGSTALWIYFSPYQSCVRDVERMGQTHAQAQCAAVLGNKH